MANENSNRRRGSAADAVNPEATFANPGESAAPSAAKNLIDLMSNNLETPSHLDASGTKYLEDITTTFDKHGFGVNMHRVNGSNYEASVIAKGNIGIALIFAKSYQNTNNLAVAAMRKDIETRMNLIDASVVIDQVIVVDERMYGRAEKMASFVKNEINSTLVPELNAVTAQSFSGGDFIASRDMSAVRQFIEARSPHSTPARDDIGVILYATRQKQNPGGFGRPEIEKIPVLAVTGYTTFYMAPNFSMNGMSPTFGATKFIPMTVITDVVSDLKNPSMLATGLALAIDGFVHRNGWMDQFTSFSKSSPNVGRLIRDDKGQPWFAKDIQSRNEFFQNYLTSMSPLLAIDIQEGRARIGALKNLIFNPGEFCHSINSFTLGRGAVDASGNPINPFIQCFRSFDGTVIKSNQEVVDSRCIDYLSLSVDIPQIDTLAPFLQCPMDIRQNIENIRKHYPSGTEALYVTYRAVIAPNFIVNVSNDLRQSLKLSYDYANDNQVYDMVGLVQNYSFTNFGGLASGGGYNQGWNPQNPLEF